MKVTAVTESGRVLVLGHRGMLGRAWCELMERRGVPHEGMDVDRIDITDPRQVASLTGYGAIVNCAAWTDVDGAEAHEAEARKLNADAVDYLAERAKAIGAALVHYSTDYIFNGRATSPYPVDQPREPINAYGRTKAEGEGRLEASGCDYRLIRTSWLYAPWGKNFVLTMLRLTREKDSLKVVDDQRGRPTSARHLAEVSLKLLRDGESGAYHVTDGGECTWFGLTRRIADLAGHACDVRPCSSDEYPRPAKRPAYSVLDLSKTEAIAGPMTDWQTNLAHVIEEVKTAEARRTQRKAE